MVAKHIVLTEGEESYDLLDRHLIADERYDEELVDRFHRAGSSAAGRLHPSRRDPLEVHAAHFASLGALTAQRIATMQDELDELRAKIEDLESAVDHES